MTIDELRSIWARFAHRGDLAPDFAEIQRRAEEDIQGRLMTDTVDLAAILASNPSLYVHGGLKVIASLQEDDAMLARESGMFNEACRNYMMRQSLAKGRPVAKLPPQYAQYGGYDGT